MSEQIYAKDSSGLTVEDLKTGVHFLPEVRLHEQVAAIQMRDGSSMCNEEVAALADFIYITMDARSRYVKSACPVCRDYLADCVRRGVDPFAPPRDVLELLAKYGVRFSRWPVRKVQ